MYKAPKFIYVYKQKRPSSKLTTVNKLKYTFLFQKLSIHIYEHMCVKHKFKKLQTHTILYACTYFCVPAYIYMEYSAFFWFSKFDVLEIFYIATYRSTSFIRLYNSPVHGCYWYRCVPGPQLGVVTDTDMRLVLSWQLV